MASSSVLHFTDPYYYQTAIRGAHLEILPTAGGDFRAELTKIDLYSLWMQRGDESLPRILQGAVNRQRAAIGFLTDSDQAAIRHCGTEVSPGEIIVDDWDMMHRRSTGPCRWGAMSLTPERLAAASIALVGRPSIAPSVTMVVRPPPPHMSRLLSLHESAGQLAKTAPDILAKPQVARALENALIHAMIMCLTENASVARSIGSRHHSAVMARLEEFLAAHESEPLYLAEICAAIDVSERTLRASCQEQIGLGPIRLLWLRRMDQTRRALIRTVPGTSTVTQIAADYGFWELGRFSVEYRKMYGESPSETLRRPPDN